MKKQTQETAFTAAKFSQLAGMDRHTLAKNIEEMGIKPSGETSGQGAALYSLRALCRAYAGGDERAERIRKVRAEAERIEIQNLRSHGELVDVAAVKRLGEKVMIAVRAKILGSSLTIAEQDALLLELAGLGKMRWGSAPEEKD